MSTLNEYVSKLFTKSRENLVTELFPERNNILNHLGLSYEKDNLITKAINTYKLSSAQAYPPSQFNLGRIYYYQSNEPENKSLAVDLITQSAKNGYPEAQNFLGMMHTRDKDGTNKAKHWFYKAHKKSSSAEYNLACVMYNSANGNVVQLSQAITYLRSAARRGHPRAIKSIQYLMGSYYQKKRKKEQQKKKKDSLEQKQLKELNNLKNMFNSLLTKI